MKYVLIDEKNGDLFLEEFEKKEEAIAAGVAAWDHLTVFDRKKRTRFEVLESVNPDPGAVDHLDGWTVWNAL